MDAVAWEAESFGTHFTWSGFSKYLLTFFTDFFLVFYITSHLTSYLSPATTNG
jgi:hypothetical protein